MKPEAVFTFHSAHGAIKGEQSLIEGGVPVKVMALPAALGAGCGICLRVDLDDLPAARRFLAEADVVPEKVYRKSFEGGRAVYDEVR